MAFSLFKKKARAVAVLDINSSSVSGAYVLLAPGKSPLVLHSVRIPLDTHATEPLLEALPRTLDTLLTELTGKGSSIVRKASGAGSIERVFVSLSSPFEAGSVQRRAVEREKPFVFTRQELNTMMSDDEKPTAGFTRMSDLVIATLLNGYELAQPFGKKVNRAELFVLSSEVQTEVLDLVRTAARKAFHTHHIDFAAFMSEAYVSLIELYPHQRDFMLIAVGNEATETLVVKHGLLTSISSMPHGVAKLTRSAHTLGLSSPAIPTMENIPAGMIDVSRNHSFSEKVNEAETAWLTEVKESLGNQAKQEPLPRTIFLLVEEPVRDFLRRLLDAPLLRSLWLTDETLSPIALTNQQFLASVAGGEGVVVTPSIALLALAAKRRYESS